MNRRVRHLLLVASLTLAVALAAAHLGACGPASGPSSSPPVLATESPLVRHGETLRRAAEFERAVRAAGTDVRAGVGRNRILLPGRPMARSADAVSDVR
jgi:hypothetical protein